MHLEWLQVVLAKEEAAAARQGVATGVAGDPECGQDCARRWEEAAVNDR